MAEFLDQRGPVLNDAFRRGGTFAATTQGIYDASGNAITTISAARMTFRVGTLADTTPGTVILAITGTANANGSSITTTGSNVTFKVTPADTRLTAFAAGSAVVYGVEIDLADGSTWTLFAGNIDVAMEIVT